MEFDDEPLGPDDASRRDDLQKSFVNIADLLPGISGGGAALLSRSVVIGAKGAGKTHLLRHIEALAKSQKRTVVFTNLTQDLVGQLRHLRGSMSLEESVSLWMNLWRLVINRSILGLFLANIGRPQVKKAIERSDFLESSSQDERQPRERLIDHLERHYSELHVRDLRSDDPMSSLNAIVQRHRSGSALNSWLSTFDFSALEADISHLIRNFGEIHFLIDGLDEFAPQNPRDWLDMQIGLFKLLFLWSGTREYLKRVHITIAMRSYVFHHAMQDPHADRARNLVLPLAWGPDSAEEFMNRRLASISGGPFAYSERLVGERPLANWLGFDTITPSRRRQPERIEQYILRHSRYSPRNVVHVINRLCHFQNRLFLKGKQLGEEEVRSSVHAVASYFGENLLRHATEEILSIIPIRGENLPDQGRREAAREFLLETVKNAIIDAIADCETESCAREALLSGLAAHLVPLFCGYKADEVISTVENVLWRSGVIACNDGSSASKWRFAWSAGEVTQGRLSPAASQIGFHSCMIDVCGIKATANGPIF